NPAGAAAHGGKVHPRGNQEDAQNADDEGAVRQLIERGKRDQPEKAENRSARREMKPRTPGDDEGLDIAEIVTLVLFAKAERIDGQHVIRSEPQAGAANEASAMPGQLLIPNSLGH